MRIERAVLSPFRLPLRAPLVTASGSVRERRGVLVALHGASGCVGFGEATPVPGFGEETPEACRRALAAFALELLAAGDRPLRGHLRALAGASPGAAASRCALDVALHDLAARERGLPVAALLCRPGRAPRSVVEVNALLAASDPEAVACEARRARAEGFRTLKLKVAQGSLTADRARVAAAREGAGDRLRLRVDANGGWTPEAAIEALRALAPLGLELVEQPVGPRDTSGLARVRAEAPVPVAADEAVADPATADAVLAGAAADWLVLKPGALGGLAPCARLAARAHALGVGVLVTSGLDGAVARAAALALAAALPDPLPACGLATGALLGDDLAASPAPSGGVLALADGDGLGVAPDPAALARLADGPAFELRPCA